MAGAQKLGRAEAKPETVYYSWRWQGRAATIAYDLPPAANRPPQAVNFPPPYNRK